MSIEISGAEAAQSYAAVRIEDCLFENNQAGGQGGAIWIQAAENAESRHLIVNNNFLNNLSDGSGGAISSQVSSVGSLAGDWIVNGFFSGNTSQEDGGALYFQSNQDAVHFGRLINCIFYDNFG